jgi:hypothetical protein
MFFWNKKKSECLKTLHSTIRAIGSVETRVSKLENKLSDIENQLKKDIVIDDNTDVIHISCEEPEEKKKTKLRRILERLIIENIKSAQFITGKGPYQRDLIESVQIDAREYKETPSESYVRAVINGMLSESAIVYKPNNRERRSRYYIKESNVVECGYRWTNIQ